MYKYFQSTENTLNYIQASAFVLAFVGIWFVDFTVTNLFLSVVFFYVFSILGVSLTLHRYYSHKSFEFKHDFIRKFFTYIAILAGRGSPLGWVYVHRLHHRHSDTEKDPHGPETIGFRFFGFKPIDTSDKKTKVFLIKDFLSKEHLMYHNNYMFFILVFAGILWSIDFNVLYFCYVLPLLGIQFSQNCFNYFAHKIGYRNHNTKDNSTNNFLLWPFILGDAWHNNHHANLGKLSTKENWWELDPVVPIARIVGK